MNAAAAAAVAWRARALGAKQIHRAAGAWRLAAWSAAAPITSAQAHTAKEAEYLTMDNRSNRRPRLQMANAASIPPFRSPYRPDQETGAMAQPPAGVAPFDFAAAARLKEERAKQLLAEEEASLCMSSFLSFFLWVKTMRP